MGFRYFNIGSIPPSQPASQHPLYEHEIEMKCCGESAVIGRAGGPPATATPTPIKYFGSFFILSKREL